MPAAAWSKGCRHCTGAHVMLGVATTPVPMFSASQFRRPVLVVYPAELSHCRLHEGWVTAVSTVIAVHGSTIPWFGPAMRPAGAVPRSYTAHTFSVHVGAPASVPAVQVMAPVVMPPQSNPASMFHVQVGAPGMVMSTRVPPAVQPLSDAPARGSSVQSSVEKG